MDPERTRDGLARLGFTVDDGLLEAIVERLERALDMLADGGSGFELWEPEAWVALDDALAGWDTRGDIGTQTDGPYLGPPGVGVAGNAGEDMLCLLARSGPIEPTVVLWDQTIGHFATVEAGG